MSDETAPALAQLAADIAKHLPGQWQYVTGGYVHSAHIRDDAGRVFNVATNGEPGRLKIGGVWQRQGSTCYTYYDRHIGNGKTFDSLPAMSVAESKGAQRIAQDIGRRFLPAFIQLWDLCEQTKTASENYDRKRRENAQILAQAVGAKIGGEDKTYVSYFVSGEHERGYFDAKASDDSVSIDAKNLPLPVACAVARLIAGKVTPEIIELINKD